MGRIGLIWREMLQLTAVLGWRSLAGDGWDCRNRGRHGSNGYKDGRPARLGILHGSKEAVVITKRVLVSGAVLFAPWAFPAASSATELTGAWNVVIKPGEVNTCGIDHTTAVFQWLLSENSGTFKVAVVGESTFPELGGKRAGSELRLSGKSRVGNLAGAQSTTYLHTELRLFLKETALGLEGTRYYLGFRREADRMLPCMTTYQVTAKRQ